MLFRLAKDNGTQLYLNIKENGAKTDMAVQLLNELPETDVHIILQMDIWYTRQAVWDKALEKGVTMIGALEL